MKKFFLLCCCLLYFIPQGYAATHINKVHNFQLTYPEEWQVSHETGTFRIVSQTNKADRYSYITIDTVFVPDVEADYTVSERTIESYKTIMTNARLLDKEFKNIEHSPADFKTLQNLAVVIFTTQPRQTLPLSSYNLEIYEHTRKMYFILNGSLYSCTFYTIGTLEDNIKNEETFYDLIDRLKPLNQN